MKHHSLFHQFFLYFQDSLTIYEYKDNDFYFLDANYKAIQSEHMQVEQYTGKSIDTIYEKNQSEKLKSFFRRALSENKPVSFQQMTSDDYPLATNPIIIEEISITPLTIAEDNQNYITVMKKAKKIANERIICENTSDLIEIIDKNAFIHYVSPSCVSIIGLDENEMTSKSFLEFLHEEDKQKIKKTLISSLKKEKSLVEEYRRRTIGQEYIWLESSFSPILEENGEINQFVVISREITKRKNTEDKLLHLAFHDSLTNLPNRRLFDEQLKQTLFRLERNKQSFAVLMLDCDSFKCINDTYGHDIGDEVIKGFAKRIKGLTRKSDMVARFGGDEFAILLTEVQTKNDVEIIADRMIEKIQEPWFFHDISIETSASIGIFYGEPTSENTPSTLNDVIKKADIALYKAKQLGKSNYQFFNHHINAGS